MWLDIFLFVYGLVVIALTAEIITILEATVWSVGPDHSLSEHVGEEL